MTDAFALVVAVLLSRVSLRWSSMTASDLIQDRLLLYMKAIAVPAVVLKKMTTDGVALKR